MKKELAPAGNIERKIFNIRGKNVMLDSDLAALYGVETKNLNKATKRNIERFPAHYMFQLTKEEAETLRFQNGTSNRGGRRYLPYVFTEQGVAMLSSVLNSARAVAINIQIIDAFIAIRQYALSAREDGNVIGRLGVMERVLLAYMEKNDKRVDDIIEVLNTMLEAEEKQETKKIGFVP